MKPIHDSLIELSESELESILASRERRSLAGGYPRSGPELAHLTTSGRLWYVAEFVHQAGESRFAGKPEDEQRWRDRAQWVAAEVTREYVEAMAIGGTRHEDSKCWSERLREVADALEGMHIQPRRSGWTEGEKLVLKWANEFCRLHGRYPTQKDLLKFSDEALADRPERDRLSISKTRIKEVYQSLRFLPREKPGRKAGS